MGGEKKRAREAAGPRSVRRWGFPPKRNTCRITVSQRQNSLCSNRSSLRRDSQKDHRRAVYQRQKRKLSSRRKPRCRILCRSKCPKNNFDRTTSPASSHRTYPLIASHTPKYSLVPSHEPIGFIIHTSYSLCAYANHIARMGSCGGRTQYRTSHGHSGFL